MPYAPSQNSPTPESLIQRSDSKNPATTCRGITARGIPCRRHIASASASPRARRASAPVQPSTDLEQDPTSAYCYHHRDQAFQPIHGPRSFDNNAHQPKRRTSTDTFVAKFSALDISSSNARSSQLPRRQEREGHTRKKKDPSIWEALCCIARPRSSSNNDDYVEVVRHRRRTHTITQQPSARPDMATAHSEPYAIPQPAATFTSSVRPSPHRMPASAPAAPVTSHTRNLMRYIPPTLDPQTTANLLAELSKPISGGDEDGYIYIFWLTPENRATWKPSDDDAESLLDSPQRGAQSQGLTHQDNLIRTYSVVRRRQQSTNGTDPKSTAEQRTILLKIGRASNVHRRMNEWTRQCGYDLSLVRFYPYVPSTQLSRSSPSPSPGRSSGAVSYPTLAPQSPNVRKVPYSHRVERLVHIELATKRLKDQGKCAACGREHREWFEVTASRDGVKVVDAVIKRWVGWADDVARGDTSF